MIVFDSRLVYGFEDALEQHFAEEGLNIYGVEDWSPEKINWAPPILKQKLIPPIQDLFTQFRENLEKSA